MGLKLAHIAIVTPGRCGLYETTRELVCALREQGADSRIVDTSLGNKLHPGGADDRGAVFGDLEWAKTADVLINHSGLGSELEAISTPVVHVAHGRPRSSFISELKGGPPVYSYHYNKNRDQRWRAVVTFWPTHKPYHEVMWPDTPVYFVPPPVDLQRWTPGGPRGYKFGGKKGSCNVVCTDAWREDIDPFPVVNAFALYARKCRGARLHIYGASANLQGWGPLLKSIQDKGNLGEVLPWVKGLENVYRAADMLITPHTIAVRSIREAMACGCPVASMHEHDIAEFAERLPDVRVKDRRGVREEAERLYNPVNTAKGFIEVLERVGKELANGERQVASG